MQDLNLSIARWGINMLNMLKTKVGYLLDSALAIATGMHHCKTAERDMQEERIICETWLTEEPKGIYAFARVNGNAYYCPGYWDSSKDDWVIPQ